MTKHTRGPWEAFSLGNFIGVTGKKSDIAYTRLKEITLDNARSIDEDEANAYLIAAAPELLEALQEILAIDGHSSLTREDSDKLDAKARAAIAKATGETV